MKRPRTKTLKSVFAWLEQEGFTVYGPARDCATWEDEDGGCMDYSAEDVIAYHTALKRGKIPQEHD